MGKATPDTTLDKMLDYINSSVDGVYVCTSEPTTYAQATSSYALAGSTSVSSLDWTGPQDWTSGSSAGRELVFGGKSSISVTSTGQAQHIAWVIGSPTSALVAVTTCSAKSLSSGDSVTIPGSISIICKDPT